MMAVELAEVPRVQPIRDRFAQFAGEVAAAAWIAAVVGAVPLAFRAAPLTEMSTARAWLAISAVCIPACLAAQTILRLATMGFRALAPDTGRRRELVGALALWIGLSTASFGAFSAVLSAVTHHRGLGATTFAIVGAGVAAGAAILAIRIAHLLRGLLSRPVLSWLLLAFAALLPLVSVHYALRAVSDPSRPAMTAAADAALFAVLATFASRLRLPSSSLRVTVPAAIVVAIATIVAGMSSVSAFASSGEDARDRVLILAPVLDRMSEPAAQLRLPRPPSSSPATAPAASSRTLEAAPSALPAPAPAESKRADKPDIIVVTLDSVRADHLPMYGYKRPTAPRLSALAAQGTVFERAYAAGPETRTALVPVLTGRWLEQCVRDDRSWPTLLRANETLAERLRAQGYTTGAVTSFQWLSEERGISQGFELFDESPFKKAHPEKGITGARAIAQAIDVYNALLSKDRPVFLWVHLFDAHQKYLEHEEASFGTKPSDLYDGEIAYVDRELGRLVDRVNAGPRAGKTVWIVHGSHGDAFGEHGFRGHPAKMYDEIVHVPLIVRLPWSRPSRVANVPVSVIDIVPTVLDLATAKGDLPGQSLVGLAEGSTGTSSRDGILISFGGIGKLAPVRAWVSGNWKLVVHGRGDAEQVKLFDTDADPDEQKDLSSERAAEVERLKGAMEAFASRKVSEIPAAPAQEP